MGDYWTNAVRHPEDVGIGCIRRTITFDTVGVAAGVPIGALEAGAIPMEVNVSVLTVFNGTTPLFTVGVPGTVAGYGTTALIIPDALGWKTAVGTLTGIPLAANTIIYAYFAPTSGTATTGKAVVMMRFANKREIDGIPFPNN